ncbi:MAG: ECF transporter S component [Clostridia bacterium]|nr:ECF transporter S component [Clostridia bacterium]
MIVLSKLHTRRLAVGALFCALVLAATLISVPTPVVGNANLGDGVLLLGAWTLGGPFGAAAVALGAMLADLIGGYAAYAPGTLLIKLSMALVAILLDRILRSFKLPRGFCHLVAGLTAELVMILGYFLYEAFVLSFGPTVAAANIPFNAVQGVLALLVSVTVYPLVERLGLCKRL